MGIENEKTSTKIELAPSSTLLYIVPKGSQGESTRYIVNTTAQRDKHWNNVMEKMNRIQKFLERYRSGDRFTACWRCFRSSAETLLSRLCITCNKNDECYPLWFICNDCTPSQCNSDARDITTLNVDLYFCPYHVV